MVIGISKSTSESPIVPDTVLDDTQVRIREVMRWVLRSRVWRAEEDVAVGRTVAA